MSEETAIELLEHTAYDDFYLLDHQIIGRLNAIKVLINKNKQLQQENKRLKKVIKEVKEYIENNTGRETRLDIGDILDKVGESND